MDFLPFSSRPLDVSMKHDPVQCLHNGATIFLPPSRFYTHCYHAYVELESTDSAVVALEKHCVHQHFLALKSRSCREVRAIGCARICLIGIAAIDDAHRRSASKIFFPSAKEAYRTELLTLRDGSHLVTVLSASISQHRPSRCIFYVGLLVEAFGLGDRPPSILHRRCPTTYESTCTPTRLSSMTGEP